MPRNSFYLTTAITGFYYRCKKYYKRKAASLRMRLNAGLRKSDAPFFGIAVLLLINTEKKKDDCVQTGKCEKTAFVGISLAHFSRIFWILISFLSGLFILNP